MSTKTYKVRFFAPTILTPTGARFETSFFDLVMAEHDRQSAGEPRRITSIGGGEFIELRDLYVGHNRTWLKGVVAFLRNDAPHKRTAVGDEVEFDLQEGDSVLEKNHFILYKSNGLLVWQVNQTANHQSRLRDLVADYTGQEGILQIADVLTREAVDLLNSGDLRRFDLQILCPNDGAMDANDFGAGLDSMASQAPGAMMGLSFSAGRRAEGLPDAFKQKLDYWRRNRYALNVKRLVVKLEDYDEPIDLFAETVKDKVTVEMRGRYPLSADIFGALNEAMDRQRGHIERFFGGIHSLE